MVNQVQSQAELDEQAASHLSIRAKEFMPSHASEPQNTSAPEDEFKTPIVVRCMLLLFGVTSWHTSMAGIEIGHAVARWLHHVQAS
jgi:hypothetical protein